MTRHDLAIGFFVFMLMIFSIILAWFLVDIWFWDDDEDEDE